MADSPVSPATPLRALPSVDQVLRDPGVREAGARLTAEALTAVVREEIERFRTEMRHADGDGAAVVDADALRADVADRCRARLVSAFAPRIVPVINATGILIHTGLGRCPLATEAIQSAASVSEGYCDVAVSRETGGRRNRSSGVQEVLRLLTGCEAALVTNNNAAATLLALHTLARDREVIVSRGQLVEIGGSFRLPEVMTSAGARLREVGTTNRTRLEDYERAISGETGALMRIHPSNFQIVGFTESVDTAALVELGRRRELPVIDDIGSGALIDFAPWGLHGETPARASIAAGADLVLFSGDKLLGGPQAGILIGRKAWIDRCARNPLMRALRVDKMTLAALEATLRLYLDPETLADRLPLLRMIAEPLDRLHARGERLLAGLVPLQDAASPRLEAATAYVGGGSLPDQELPSLAVTLEGPVDHAEAIKRKLRLGEPSVFCRLRRNRLEFDLRAVADREIEPLAEAIVAAWRSSAA